MNNKIDIVMEIATESFLYWDAIMRQVAFEKCETQCRGYVYCERAKKCIDRPWINHFWRRLASLN